MYKQGQYEDPMEFLSRVHSAMRDKYILGQVAGFANIEEEKLKAQELQTFLMDLKTYAATGDTSSLTDALTIQAVYDTIQANTTNNQILFQRFRGDVFEQELGSVIRRTFEVGGIQLSKETIDALVVGNLYGTTQANFDESIAKDFAKSIDKEVKTTLHTNVNPAVFKLGAVQQKTDVKGPNVSLDFKVETSDYLKRIISILNEATITAKNYGSSIEDIATLKLGLSHPLRSIGSALASLGVPDTDINAFFRDMSHSHYKYSKDSKFKEYLFGLQFMYELTGEGTVSRDLTEVLSGAKYLIYNNPTTGEIYVQSTAALIAQVLDQPQHWMPANYSPFEHYKISVARKAEFWKY